METINTQVTPNTAGAQGTSAAPQRKGGFVQVAAVAQGCCGEMSTGDAGCCGAPAQAGCCGTMVPKTAAMTSSGGCCG